MTNFSRYDVDARSMMEDLYIGPQAEVLELIDSFNNDYAQRNGAEQIGITNKFRWKPGTYDKVKAMLELYWFGWNRRPSGMDSLFYRINNYSKERMRDKLNDIERKLYSLRSDGRSFLDDLDEVTEIFNIFRNRIEEASEVLQEIYPDMSITIDDSGPFRTHELELRIPIKDININVSSGGHSEDGVFIGAIPFGDVEITFKILLHKWFNRSYQYLANNNFPDNMIHGYTSSIVSVQGTAYPTYNGTLHPYISTRSSYSSICMGELHTNIVNSFIKYDWNVLGLLLDQWLSYYKVGVTGPLNGIQYAFIGKPEVLTNEFFDIVAPIGGSSCFNHQASSIYGDDAELDGYKEVIKQCDEIKCQLRNDCNSYRRYTVLSVQLEEMRCKITNEWEFDTLFPAQQMKEPFVNWLIWRIRDCYDYDDNGDLEPFWAVIYNAIENCQWPIVLLVIEDLVKHQLIVIHPDAAIKWLHSVTKCKTQEALVELVMPLFEETIKIEADMTDMLTDEQEQMIMWAQSRSPR